MAHLQKRFMFAIETSSEDYFFSFFFAEPPGLLNQVQLHGNKLS